MLVTHGEAGFLSDPHAPLGTLSPRGLCDPQVEHPWKGHKYTFPESRFGHLTHGSDKNHPTAVGTHGPRVIDHILMEGSNALKLARFDEPSRSWMVGYSV